MSDEKPKRKKPRPRSQATGQPYWRRRHDGIERTRRSVMLDDAVYERAKTLVYPSKTDVYGTMGELIETAMKLLLKHHKV